MADGRGSYKADQQDVRHQRQMTKLLWRPKCRAQPADVAAAQVRGIALSCGHLDYLLMTEKKACLDRAKHWLAEPNPERVRYAALELRIVMELLTYEKLRAASDRISRSVPQTSKPPLQRFSAPPGGAIAAQRRARVGCLVESRGASCVSTHASAISGMRVTPRRARRRRPAPAAPAATSRATPLSSRRSLRHGAHRAFNSLPLRPSLFAVLKSRAMRSPPTRQ